jgi:hypothetical protein
MHPYPSTYSFHWATQATLSPVSRCCRTPATGARNGKWTPRLTLNSLDRLHNLYKESPLLVLQQSKQENGQPKSQCMPTLPQRLPIEEVDGANMADGVPLRR